MTDISRPHCEPAHIAPLRPKLFIRGTLHEFAQLIKQRGLIMWTLYDFIASGFLVAVALAGLGMLTLVFV